MANGTHIRRGSREQMGRGPHARTESMTRLTKGELESGRIHLRVLEELGDAPPRPVTRGDCIGAHRPCPWVSCKHNLFLDVTNAEAIKFNFPNLEAEEVPAEKSCALDVADLGGASLEDVAETLNVTRQRIQQVENKGLIRLRAMARRRGGAAKVLGEFSESSDGATKRPRALGAQGSVFAPKVERIEPDDDVVEDEPPTRISFFADPDSERVDELVTSAVWNMFARWQNGRGFDCRSNQSKAQSKSMAARRGAQPAAPTPVEEETMAEQKKRGEMLERTAEALRAFESKHGRTPHPKELFDVMGADVGKSVENVRMAMKRVAARGPRPATTTKPTPAPGRGALVVRKSAPPPKNRVKPAPAASPRATSSDPFVAELITKRDDLRRKADALDVAIEAYSVAL